MTVNRNWLAAAGLVYVAVWIVGLLIAPTTPEGANLAAFYAANQHSLLAQAFLVHGLAAFALVVLAAALVGAARRANGGSTPLAALDFGAALLAAGVSLIQAALGAAMVSPAVLAGDAGALLLLRALIDTADTFKLLALALFVGAALPLAARSGVLPRWLGWAGIPLVLTLIGGGLSFVVVSPAFTAMLYVSLPLLLLWVGGVSMALLRGVRAVEPAARGLGARSADGRRAAA